MSQAHNYLTHIPAQVKPSPRVAAAADQLVTAKAELRVRMHNLLRAALDEYEWTKVVVIAIDEARLTEAHIARGLEMSRSTVNRWYSGNVLPPKINMPALGEKLIRLVDRWLS